MLLLHQVGSVKIGDVVRYTISYSPSQDRILPSPEKLHVRIRNTSAVALRAAFVHGPYTLSVAAYPAAFSPNDRFANPRRYGVPAFEPMLKAGGAWECELVVPDDLREAAATGHHGAGAARWVVELSSQVVFSTSAAVGFELVVARDRKSLGLGQTLPVVGSQTPTPQPGRVSDHQHGRLRDAQPKGVFSRAVDVVVEDTATLWNTPRLPGWDDGPARRRTRVPVDRPAEPRPRTQRRVHLVVLTHGLHSNLGADMLFLKESIDAAAKQAKIDAKARRARERRERAARRPSDARPAGAEDADAAADDGHDDDDDEEVIVRGYSGNATKTERGIKYLGKRLARYVLSMTYPDQPFFPIGKGTGEGLAEAFKGDHRHDQLDHDPNKARKHNTTQADPERARHDKLERPYSISSISFVGHSLGGLVQMYAVAYIQKHSPRFFDLIEPINFIALASPFLGLSNENPLYVKFALDFGLVGRTGQDLGLTWRAPTIARSGWGAIVGNLGESAHKTVYGETQPESKPLLRILPTGPAHTALKKFRNRTVYSNVVNDGIVPLRTSCLLFLDWQGLGRVEKARRDAGLVETVVGFGWAELMGTNMASPRLKQLSSDERQSDSGESTPREAMREVPQPSSDAMVEDDRASIRSLPTPYADADAPPSATSPGPGALAGFFNLFRSSEPPREQQLSPKQRMILRRGQTMPLDQAGPSASSSSGSDESTRGPKVTAGHELEQGPDGMTAPPKTTFFESAGDLLNPGMPGMDYILDPTKRPRTIFHDRVYHPSDMPPPPAKRRPSTLVRRRHPTKTSSASLQSAGSGSSSPRPPAAPPDPAGDGDDTPAAGPDDAAVDAAGMRVEEKIARAYHRDLSWRKVLVKLEPDAHNNIFVRRMFANAYGWPVVKHLVDAHFSDSAVARARTDDARRGERALDVAQPPDEHGAETTAPLADADAREALDEVPDLPPPTVDADPPRIAAPERSDSVSWSDRDWVDSDNDSDPDDRLAPPRHAPKHAQQARLGPASWSWAEKIVGKGARARSKSPNGSPADGARKT